jgi:hypothetical protein
LHRLRGPAWSPAHRSSSSLQCCLRTNAVASHDLIQCLRLIGHGGTGRSRLLDQRSVLLCYFIHLADCAIDLLYPAGLLARGGSYFRDDGRDLLDRRNDQLERLPRFGDQHRAGLHSLDTVGDELLDLFGGGGRAACETADLACDDGKAAALLTGPRSLHCRIQRQEIGLECDIVNDTDDVSDLLGRFIDAIHRSDA